MTEFAKPRKFLGQNFLKDDNIIRKIVASLHLQENDVVLEIGPGRGALTEHLIDHLRHSGGELHLVEFDRDLIEYWQSRADQTNNMFVHGVDILKFDFSSIPSFSEHAVKVIGNLPYNISSPVLFHLAKTAELISSQIVMLQNEVVDRLAAVPGSKQFGRLAVMMQYRYTIEKLFTVPATAFYPPPKVESAIARLQPLRQIEQEAIDVVDLELVVKTAFSMRRKTLRNNLKPLLAEQDIADLGIDPGMRAETLEVTDFVRLANQYSQST